MQDKQQPEKHAEAAAAAAASQGCGPPKKRAKGAGPRARLCWLGGLAGLSLCLFALSWLSHIYGDALLSNMQLRNGSLSFAWWQRPVVRAVYKIRIFNYTNVEEFEAGLADKLRVSEAGPYVYRETMARLNPEIDPDEGTVTYQEMRTYQWEGGSPDDEIINVPNVPLFSAMAFSRDMNFFAQMSMTALLSTIRAKPFLRLPAGDFLWGYEDKLFQIVKPWQRNIPYDQFGILAFKSGLSRDRMTISTGTEDMKNFGYTVRFNGQKNRNIWHDETCDKIEGSDGTMFPPKLIRDHNNVLKVYAKEMCRSIPLHYSGESEARGIPTYRYKLPEDIFNSTPDHDSCFCEKQTDYWGRINSMCSPRGLFNGSACNFGAPMLSSLPHFFRGDKSLLEHVEGLEPREELHDTYLDLHPRLAVPIGGFTRIQVNLEARKADAVPFMGRVNDGTILPILWVEVGVDDIPESVMSLLYHAHFTASAVEACLQWGSLLGLLLSGFGMYHVISRRRNQMHPGLQRNVSGQDPLIDAIA